VNLDCFILSNTVYLVYRPTVLNYIIVMTAQTKGDAKLDLAGAKHDVWLVKVPKYLANKWLNAPDGCPVGKLRIAK